MCFDLSWFENLLIWLVVVCAVIPETRSRKALSS